MKINGYLLGCVKYNLYLYTVIIVQLKNGKMINLENLKQYVIEFHFGNSCKYHSNVFAANKEQAVEIAKGYGSSMTYPSEDYVLEASNYNDASDSTWSEEILEERMS